PTALQHPQAGLVIEAAAGFLLRRRSSHLQPLSSPRRRSLTMVRFSHFSMGVRPGPCSGSNGRQGRGCLPCSWTRPCTGSPYLRSIIARQPPRELTVCSGYGAHNKGGKFRGWSLSQAYEE
ncbi:unnamed protein product, partial [Ectocarpus sp. 12 AP-2014]